MESMYIINMIDRGEISAKEGISLIKKHRRVKHLKRGWLLRASIYNDGRKFTFFVPLSLIGAGFLIAKRFIPDPSKYNGKSKGKSLQVFKKLDSRDIIRIINELRLCKSTGFIDVHDADSSVVISIV